MGTAKKFKDNYPQDKKDSDKVDNAALRKEIDAYIDKIQDLLKEPEKQKKAAQIIANLLKK